MGVVTNKRLAAQRRKISRHIELNLRQAERRSPEAAERRARNALRTLVVEGLSIRESAGRVGVTYHEARSLIRAAEVADARRDQDVGDQV